MLWNYCTLMYIKVQLSLDCESYLGKQATYMEYRCTHFKVILNRQSLDLVPLSKSGIGGVNSK